MQAARRTPLNGDTPDSEPDTQPDTGAEDEAEHEPEDSGDAAENDTDTDEVDEAATAPAGRRTPVFLLFWGIALVGLALDQITKHWASTSLVGKGSVDVYGDWLDWHLTFNSGASFSMGTSYTEVLSVIAICAVLVVLYLSLRLGSKGWAVGLGFLLAGVAGNLTDRIFRAPGPLEGHVVDFIALPNWPIFNIADICINIAAALIILQTIRGIRLNGTFHD